MDPEELEAFYAGFDVKAKLSAAQINDLPDSDFLYIEPGGTKDATGRTVPRSLRHFPVPDIEHVRNALARIPQSDLPANVKAAAEKMARSMLERMTKDEEEIELSAEELESFGTKSASASSFSLDEAKEGDFLVAFAKLGVVDKDRHITEPGAFPVGREVPVSAYGHTSWPQRGARLPVGKSVIAEEGGFGKAVGGFFLDTTQGKDTYLTVKHLGPLQEWSYGYKTLAARRGKDASGPVLHLTKLDVRELSPTLVGAGVETRTLGIKSGDDDGPLAGLPFAEHVERVLLDVGEIVARSKGLRELRVKSGRELSEANRTRLVRLRDSIALLQEQAAEVEELLARTDPDAAKDAPEVLRLMVEHERTVARLNGVAIAVGG